MSLGVPRISLDVDGTLFHPVFAQLNQLRLAGSWCIYHYFTFRFFSHHASSHWTRVGFLKTRVPFLGPATQLTGPGSPNVETFTSKDQKGSTTLGEKLLLHA